MYSHQTVSAPSRRGRALAGLAALAFAVLAAAAEARTATVAISRSPLAAPFYVAIEHRLFEAEGVDVHLIECVGGRRCLGTVLSGESDLATVSDLPLVLQSFVRPDFSIVATLVTSSADLKIVARRSSGVNAISDLVGRRVGAVPGTSSDFFLDLVLLYQGIDRRTVSIHAIEPESASRALAEGRVDAVVVAEPFGYDSVNAIGNDAAILDTPDLYRETFNLVCSRRYCESSPETISRVLRALARATDLIASRESEAKRILVDRLGVEADFVDWIWPGLEFGISLDQSLVVTLETVARWAVNAPAATTSPAPNYLDFVNAAPLEQIDPARVALIH